MMKTCFTPSLALLAVLVTASTTQADLIRRNKPAGPDSVTIKDVEIAAEHVAARYASWAERKKQEPPSTKPALIYGQLKLATPASAEEDATLKAVRKRGTIMNLHTVGGYPKMLGETYNIEVGMGTPVQPFNLTADTGSMLTWAVQASCKEVDCPGVKTKKLYDPSKSKTSKPIRGDHEAYGDGEMDLNLFSDVVTLDKMTIQATVGGANKTFERDGKLEHDGLFGLGRKLNADPEPVLDSLATQDKRFNEIVALDLSAQPTIEIGGYDFVKYPKLANFKVNGDDGWLLEQSTITALGATQSDRIDLLLDSGSSVSMLPASRMEAIMTRPGLRVHKTVEEPIVYSMPCDSKLNIQLVLPDGIKVNVKEEDILMKSNDPKTPGCLSLLVGTTNPFLPAVAGTPMLKSLYTVLSKTENGDWIGVAPLLSGAAK
ncbi:hypothetical protein NDA16_004172 [Ustilago loliicola]|nr:hypothetical protein NDA16_004172 [Ustilago loliicola]